MFYEWNGYKLRLDAKRIEQLEDALGGRSPLSVFANVDKGLPPLKDMLSILHCALVSLQSNIKKDDVYEIYDEYINAGNNYTDFIKAIVEVFKVSGLIPKEENTEKN